MRKLINLLLTATGAIVVVVGLAAFHSASVVLGFSMIGLGYFLDRRRERLSKETLSIDTARRIAELTASPWNPHQNLKVAGSPWMTIGLILGGVGCAWAIHDGITSVAVNWKSVLGGALFLPIIAIALPRSLAGLGKPTLELDRHGLRAPIHGHIPWREVSGIHLYHHSFRGKAQSFLFFRVARYRQFVANIHWTERLLATLHLGALARGVVGIRLTSSGEPPETLYAVARFLWKEATGNDYNWNPVLSAEYNEATKRMSTRASRAPGIDVDRRPEDVLAELEEARKDFAVLEAEHTRMSSWHGMLIGIAVTLIVLGIALAWLSRH